MSQSLAQPHFIFASDQSLLVTFGDDISLAAHHLILRLLRSFAAEPVAGVRNLHPAYASVLLSFNAMQLRHSALQKIIQSRLAHLAAIPLPEPRHVQIPVCYGGEFGPDLAGVAELHGLTIEQAIALHASTEYLVYFLGFVPGFGYLGELPSDLRTPRWPTPRKLVPAGSIGIAGSQTGIYPFATPGGWRLLGRTPAALFRADRDPMNFLSIGDRVQFVPITPAQFAQAAHA